MHNISRIVSTVKHRVLNSYTTFLFCHFRTPVISLLASEAGTATTAFPFCGAASWRKRALLITFFRSAVPRCCKAGHRISLFSDLRCRALAKAGTAYHTFPICGAVIRQNRALLITLFRSAVPWPGKSGRRSQHFSDLQCSDAAAGFPQGSSLLVLRTLL